MNNNGESESPCRTPLDAPKWPLGSPLIIIEKFADDKHPMIHFLHLSPKSFLSKTIYTYIVYNGQY